MTNDKQAAKYSIFSWSRYSERMLRSIERKILSFCRTAYKSYFVDIGPIVGDSDKVWTISMNTNNVSAGNEKEKTPLVLLHGLGAGVALWCLNLDSLADEGRPLYALDLLGFGRSSRPNFSTDALVAEKQFVNSIEEWRKEMQLDSFILFGHSMGGYLATSYAISYPTRVKHLILADPWGFSERSEETTPRKLDGTPIPFWIRAVFYAVQPLNPLWAIRVAGPFGQWVISRVRPDISRKYAQLLGTEETLINEYIYQCNAQNPSGESAFHSMMTGFVWAKHPMVNRINDLHRSVPITLIYGSRSWIDNTAGELIKEKRVDSDVNIKVIVGAGHHVYADKPEVFNGYVNDICDSVDKTQRFNKKSTNSEHKEQILDT